MSLTLLRVLFVVESLIAVIAINFGLELIGWQHQSPDLMNHSPDAWYMKELVLRSWESLSGCCFGITLTLSILAIAHRKHFAHGGATLRAHWIALGLPPIVVFFVAMQVA